MKKISIYFGIVFLILGKAALAQEKVVDEHQPHQIKITKNNPSKGSLLKSKAAYKKPIALPFFDEFIQSKNYPYSSNDLLPNDSLWINSGAMVNNSYPINPPSYGCVTLDGLADSGKAYTYVPNAFGDADVLTSQHINLFGLTTADSVYFSFYYQPEGKGDYPDIGDSLVLEFKTKNQDWIPVWGVDGTIADPAPTAFTFVIIPIQNPLFFDSIFQFRFRNIATISGNNDHWNIDYVVLNKLRTYNDATNDLAITNIPTKPLINYFSMPFKQFKVNKAAEMNSKISNDIFNNWKIGRNVEYNCYVLDGISNDTILKYIKLSNNVNANSFITPTPTYSPIYNIPDTLTEVGCSYRCVNERFYFKPPSGEINANDTLNYRLNFSNYLAYDDGTAEQVYGILGNEALLAYEFNLNVTDTLKAIQIQFAHMNVDATKYLFDLLVWQNIDIPNGTTDKIIQRETFLKPIYIDSLNGWATYALDTAQIVPSGKFYIGIKHLQSAYLNFGFDVNNDAHTQIYYNTGLGWFQSILNGALLMRPLFDACVPFGTAINNVSANEIINYKVYPNPASQHIIFETDIHKIDELKIYDVVGKQVLSIFNTYQSSKINIDIETLNSGLYIINALNYTTGKSITTKFIKE